MTTTEMTRTADDTAPQRGNFRVIINDRKTPDNDQPMFTGTLTLPGSTEERTVALWAHESKTGLVFNGTAAESLRAQIEQRTVKTVEQPSMSIKVAELKDKALEVKPGDVVLFTNAQRAENPARPHYFGYWNPGKGQPLHRISAWERIGEQGKHILLGGVERDEPTKRRDAAKDVDVKKAPKRSREMSLER